jgi:hypothetical protein
MFPPSIETLRLATSGGLHEDEWPIERIRALVPTCRTLEHLQSLTVDFMVSYNDLVWMLPGDPAVLTDEFQQAGIAFEYWVRDRVYRCGRSLAYYVLYKNQGTFEEGREGIRKEYHDFRLGLEERYADRVKFGWEGREELQGLPERTRELLEGKRGV